MKTIANFINGEFVAPQANDYLDDINPATKEIIARIPSSDERDAEAAIAAAKAAFPAWSKLSVSERVTYLRKFSRAIAERADELALAETLDTGKPLKVSKAVDIARASTNFEYFADALTHFHGESFPMDEQFMNYTLHSPLGVVSCISPWNLPLYLLSWKIAPALAAGNTVVAKPSEITPMTAYLLCEIAQSIGLPKGVLNIIHGTGPKAGDPLTRHPDIKAVSFTGSTMTGSLVAQNAAKGFKKVSLEMGGKNPTIIFADANFDEAVDGAVKAAFSNQGQICLCGSRILIERSIYSQFKEAITAKTKTLRVGDPLDKGHHLGAVVSKTHYEKILGHIQIAKEEGGKILCGGEALHTDRGYFIAPTLIEGLDANCRTNQEEIFGPVATLIPFDNEDEALAIANGTRYGLSANIWTKDLTRAHRVSRRLDAGIVWVNTWLTRDLRTPFGGMKESGVGREGGIEALAFFSEVKNVCLKL